jgi:hypothetical protein
MQLLCNSVVLNKLPSDALFRRRRSQMNRVCDCIFVTLGCRHRYRQVIIHISMVIGLPLHRSEIHADVQFNFNITCSFLEFVLFAVCCKGDERSSGQRNL